MNIRLVKENYFFYCLSCRTMGNLPGLLARAVDASERSDEEKLARLKEIKEEYPYPKNSPAPRAVPRKG